MDFNGRCETIKTFRKKMRDVIQDFGLCEERRDTESTSKAKLIKWTSSKNRSKHMDPVKKVKMQATIWRKSICSHITGNE